jgi:ankyrin repeat protein
LDRGADVNRQDKLGNTALLKAAQEGHKEIVSVLLEKGADLSAVDSRGKTALEIAKEQQRAEIVQLLQTAAAAR